MGKRLFLFLTVWCLSIGLAMAQRNIRGVVVSADDDGPVIGASILVSGTTVGTVTDLDGNFTLSVPNGAKKITVSYVGMVTQEVAITNNMKIRMESDSEVLDDVVVVAYGTASARSLTASIASVKGDALKDVPGQAVDQMLQGRAAGVQISSAGSAMGQAPTINIRGVASITNSTTPLYVVDGMPINTDNVSTATDYNPISDINPADIKSIDILKDAAATAMYGSRAAAGVVLITTNSGSQGKAKVSYDYTIGINDPTKLIKTQNAQQYTEIKTLGRINSGYETANTEKPMYNLQKDSKGNIIDTDWNDLLFRTGISQNHNLNVTGGNDRAQYYVGAGYMKQDGITIGDSYQRFSFKGNANIKANKWLKIGINTSFTNSAINVIDQARGGSVYAIGGFSRMGYILPPNVAAYNEDGTPNVRGGKYLGSGANNFNISYYNPMGCIDGGQYSNTNTNRVLATGYAELTPIKGLTLKTQYGIDWTFSDNAYFRTPDGGDGYPAGYASDMHTTRKIWTFTNTADYRFKIAKHNFDILLGTEATESNHKTLRRNGTELLDPDMKYVEASWATYTGSGARNESAMFSYISRLTYDWNSRYYLTANLRRDGLSKLGRKWGNFWGVSGAWRMSDEKFWKPIKSVVDDFKLKASYGVVGNTNVAWYASQSTYSTAYYNGAAALVSSSVNDANLGWEQTGTFDLGFTAALLGGRINVDLDYFDARSKDLILAAPVAYSTGIYDSTNGAAIATNMGKARNSGVEFSVNASVIENKKFSWNTTFNVSFVKNEVLELASDIVEDGTGANNITKEGYSMAQLYVYPTAGVDPTSGRRIAVMKAGTPEEYKALIVYKGGAKMYKYDESAADHMGEQVSMSDWEAQISGNTKPTWYGGWTNNFRYGRWDASLFFQFSGGNKIYNGTKATLSDGRFWNNSLDYYENTWKNPGDIATYPKVEYNDNYSNGSAYSISDWVENGAYLRLKNVAIGYNVDTKKLPTWLGLSSLRVYAQIQNLFCITGYTGMDPEINSRADSANTISGIDKNTTPQTRTYTFGVNVSF